jgi:hypothetical protein
VVDSESCDAVLNVRFLSKALGPRWTSRSRGTAGSWASNAAVMRPVSSSVSTCNRSFARNEFNFTKTTSANGATGACRPKNWREAWVGHGLLGLGALARENQAHRFGGILIGADDQVASSHDLARRISGSFSRVSHADDVFAPNQQLDVARNERAAPVTAIEDVGKHRHSADQLKRNRRLVKIFTDCRGPL